LRVELIRRFTGIAGEVVDLRLRSADQFEVAAPQCGQIAPAELRGVLGLRVEVARRQLLHEIDAVESARQWDAAQRGKRRREIDGAHGLIHDPRGDAGSADDHRHVQRRFVEQEAVRQLPMLAERLAVIADDGDDGVLPIDAGEQAGNLGIGIGQLAVVGLRIGGGWGVRRMRIVEMYPGEEGTAVMSMQPGQGAVDDVTPPAFRFLRAGIGGIAPNVVVVDVEPAIEPEAVVEDESADEGTGPVPPLLKGRGQRLPIGRKHPTAVVAQPVMRRDDARENAGMGGKGEGDGGVGVGEGCSALRQRGERWGVGAEVVGSGGVEGDEEEVSGGWFLAFAGDEQKQENAERRTQNAECRKKRRPW
jgi:hypothetical protein